MNAGTMPMPVRQIAAGIDDGRASINRFVPAVGPTFNPGGQSVPAGQTGMPQGWFTAKLPL
jgi:hypothetical protein